MKKLAIVTTHPIQYYAPVFKLLQSRGVISIKVYYTLGNNGAAKYDAGFKKLVTWDIPLTEGYDYEWVNNTSANPGSHHYKGVVNPDITHQIERWSPDAVLVYGWAYSGHLKVLRYFKGKVPVYFKGDSTLLNEVGGLKTKLKKLFLRWVYSHVDNAFYAGSNNREYFKQYGIKDTELSFMPHAVDNERFSQTRSGEAIELRTALNLTDNDILILYAGKFDAVKNISLLLKAFMALKKTNVHLLLAGNGVEETQLKALAAKSGTSNAHFTGFKNQSYMPVLYQAANLVCLPSLSETWGLAINEAMACGKAVLVSDKVGCAADLVKPGVNGHIFKSNDLDDLTNQLMQLTASKANLAELGANSFRIITDWNFEEAAKAIEDKLLA